MIFQPNFIQIGGEELIQGTISQYNSSIAYIGEHAFCECVNLSMVSVPECSYIGSYAFQSCFVLQQASFPSCNSIGSAAFSHCSSLTSLYLMSTSIVSLAHSNAFQSTPIASGTGSIYVPASLLASYQTATNWSFFSNAFVGI